jgi:hypothetical protein
MMIVLYSFLLITFFTLSFFRIFPATTDDLYIVSLGGSGILLLLGIFYQYIQSKSEQSTDELSLKIEELKKEIHQKNDEYASLGSIAREAKEKEHALKLALSNAEKKIAALHESAEASQSEDLIQFIALLQEKGRIVDFLMEDLNKYSDEQVGGVARFVHQGCGSIVKELFHVAPVYTGSEGERIVLKEYDPLRFKLTGKVSEKPPFAGVVVHKGWISKKVTMPKSTHGQTVQMKNLSDRPGELPGLVIAPAEIEM